MTEPAADLAQWIRALAEEFRNPLVSLRTFMELLPEHFDDPDFRIRMQDLVCQDLERIERIMHMATATVDSLSAVGDSGDIETIAIAAHLDALLDEYRDVVSQKRILVLKELDRGAAPVRIRREPLDLALRTLLRFCFERTTERGDLYIASNYLQGSDGEAGRHRCLIRHWTDDRPSPDASGEPLRLATDPIDLVVVGTLLESIDSSLDTNLTAAGERVWIIDIPAD